MDGHGSAEGEVPREEPTPGAELERLPPLLREALSQPGVPPQLLSMTLAAFGSYSGPLPPADQIRAYEEALPGSADRILAMAERQQEHRLALEKVTVNEAALRSRWV